MSVVSLRWLRKALLCALILCLLLPSSALGWVNGDSGGNGFSTHDWILREAYQLAASNGTGWLKLSTALAATDDPDTQLHDYYHHVYNSHHLPTPDDWHIIGPVVGPVKGMEGEVGLSVVQFFRRISYGIPEQSVHPID